MQKAKAEQMLFKRWLSDKQAYDMANYMNGSKGRAFYTLDEYFKELKPQDEQPMLSESEKKRIIEQAQKINERLGVKH